MCEKKRIEDDAFFPPVIFGDSTVKGCFCSLAFLTSIQCVKVDVRGRL